MTNFTIDNKHASVSIRLKTPNEKFLKSIAKLNFIVAPSLDASFSEIQSIGSTIVTLSNWMEKKHSLSYNTVCRLIWCLYQQQHMLTETSDFCFYNLAIEDIVVIDNWHFICCNPNLCSPLSFERKILFKKPFIKNRFSSPELMNITCIPSSTSIETFYYSLASVAFFCLFRTVFCHSDLETSLLFDSILETKLYWFLKRALEIESTKRKCIFI